MFHDAGDSPTSDNPAKDSRRRSLRSRSVASLEPADVLNVDDIASEGALRETGEPGLESSSLAPKSSASSSKMGLSELECAVRPPTAESAFLAREPLEATALLSAAFLSCCFDLARLDGEIGKGENEQGRGRRTEIMSGLTYSGTKPVGGKKGHHQ